MTRLLPCLLLLALAGCRTVVEAPAGEASPAERRAVYQTIANALPDANFGWGEPPAVVEMTASARAEAPPPEPAPLVANERGFKIRYAIYRPRNALVPYEAVREVSYAWQPMPNVFFAALIVLPLQVTRATVVLEIDQVEGLAAAIEADTARLEAISRQAGLPGPWSHAQNVRWKVEDDAALYGAGRLALHFDYLTPLFAWIPIGGKAARVAEAFAWAAAHPDAPALAPAPEPEAPADGGSQD